MALLRARPRPVVLSGLLATALALAVSCGARAPHQRDVRSPHDGIAGATSDGATPADANARCAGCHADVASEWRASNHADAYRQRTFQDAFALERLAACASCHGPEGKPSDADAANAVASQRARADLELGVACTSCHPGGARAASGIDAACARCHEFPFPGESSLVQKTVSEHAASSKRDVACVDCHMPQLDAGRRDHRFSVSRNPEFLRAAARISAAKDGDALIITFERAKVGHALPTGDVFRRLDVIVTGTRGGVPASVERGLSRKSKLGDDADDRPFAGGDDVARVRVPLAGLASPLVWKVVYQRVRRPLDRGENEVVADAEIELAAGRTN